MSPSEPPLPDPPADLAARGPLVRTVKGPWYRFHPRARDPIHFGRSRTFRFDAPDGSYGVLYAGTSVDAAFLEAFGQTGSSLITASELERKGLAVLDAARPLEVVDLAAEGALTRIGADARIFAGDRAVARRWSAAIRRLPGRPDGILYPVRREPSRTALALFDHVAGELSAELAGSLLDERNLGVLRELMERYGLSFLDDR